MRKAIHGNKAVWLDVKKTREELKPKRIVHRTADILTSFESTKQPEHRAIISKDLSRKTVSRSDIPVGCIKLGKWAWQPDARDFYSPEQLDQAMTWAGTD